MKTVYKVVSDTTLKEFTESVNDLLSFGYKLKDPLIVTSLRYTSGGSFTLFTQVLTKEE